MSYLKNLFGNFLVVFFVLHILLGVEVTHPTKLPHIGGDLLFAAGLGFLNSLVYPLLSVLSRPVHIGKIAMFSFLVALVAFALLKVVSIGVAVVSLSGYFFAVGLVGSGCTITNYLEMRRSHPRCPHSGSQLPPQDPLN